MTIIFLGNMCNNDCFMCSTKGSSGFDFVAGKDEVLKKIEKNRGDDILEFTGGEATEHPDILEFVEKANSLDYGVIKLSTNGRNFSDNNFAKKIAERGLARVDLALHGTEKVHNDIVQDKDAFKEAVRGIKNLQKNNIDVLVASVLMSKNKDDLRNLYLSLLDLGVEQIGILDLVPDGRSSGGQFEKFAISFKQRKAFFYENSDILNKFEFVGVLNFNRCMLPKEISSNWSIATTCDKMFMGYDYGDLKDIDPIQAMRSKVENKFCNKCKSKHKCTGFSPESLKIFKEEGVEEMMKYDNMDEKFS